MESYNYRLEKYSGMKSRFTCPGCGKKNEFARYINTAGEYLPEHIGRCNRESSCGYHMKPKDYFENNPSALIQPHSQHQAEPAKQIEYIKSDVLKATLKAYSENSFVKYLNTLFDNDTVVRIINQYGLGTTKDGACIFWQVDAEGLVRTGKVIKYGTDGHRDKTKPPYFIHTKLNIENISQCLFGLHQLSIDALIGLVESEKTACIMSGKMPEYLWMATGGKTNLSKVDALKGKKVVAFPDTDAFDEWKERLTPYGFKVSNALQSQITDEEKGKGLDLADFVTANKNYFETLKDGRVIEMHPGEYPLGWNLSTGSLYKTSNYVTH